ncbi:MAG: YggS family pyridoxal phosphate-dependent enzyme [Nevskia sp.]|nr:YggS family pyridoxal phosphate-dependent enzyme [Nevskia sp.]
MNHIAANLAGVHRRLQAACARAGRPSGGVRLVAVTKGFGAAAVAAAVAAGQREFGESYVQEAVPKMQALGAGPPLAWHFIGPVQSNKTRDIAAHFQWVHGVDRLKIGERLSVQRQEPEPLDVCVQVNISGEISKSGCTPADAPDLCAKLARLPGIRLRGLMAIPAAGSGPESARPAFRRMRALFEAIGQGGAVDPRLFDTLSMGMSADIEVAIEEGATLVRVGTAIFGSRE